MMGDVLAEHGKLSKYKTIMCVLICMILYNVYLHMDKNEGGVMNNGSECKIAEPCSNYRS